MTVKELYRHLETMIPPTLSCDWDNDGLMCCPDGERKVKKALVCLDVTTDAVKKAVDEGFDVIVSHHPFIFKGLKSLDEGAYIPKKAMELIRAGISVISFHTRLDAVSGGVNDTLASLVGLSDVEPFGDGIGRIGFLPSPTPAKELAQKVKSALDAPTVFLAGANIPAYKVALLGGSGEDELFAAMAAGADTYISGNLGYHTMTDAPDMGINLIEAGHFYTEDPVCDVLCHAIEDLSVEAVKYNSNRTLAI